MEKENENLNISLNQFELPMSISAQPKMFYHQFRTSSELCAAGLFTPDSQSPTKKHRKLKFCKSVLSGWKDKFCKHLDNCKKAQEFFATHPVNTEMELIQRKARRLRPDDTSFMPKMKRPHLQDQIISFDRSEYLCMLAAGFVSSTGVSKSIFENEFLKNLCFSLHWQCPSPYIIQKRISDISNSLMERAYTYLSQQPSITLIVYLWADISKRFAISYIACTPSNTLVFLSYTQCKQDNWNFSYIIQQCQNTIQFLNERSIFVNLVYFDDSVFYENIKNSLLMNEQQFIPVIGNTVHWCKELLTVIFSFPFFKDLKENISTVYSSIQKKAPLADLLKQKLQSNTTIKLFALDEDDWISLFKTAEFIVNNYNSLIAIQQQGITLELIQPCHPLYSMNLSEIWKSDIQQAIHLFKDIALCTSPTDIVHLNPYTVYLSLYKARENVKHSIYDEDINVHVSSLIDQCIHKYFNMEVLYLYQYFARGYDVSTVQMQNHEDLFTTETAKNSIHQYYHGPNWNQCCIEFDNYIKEREKMGFSSPSYEWWLDVGKMHYPELASIVIPIIAFPRDEVSYNILSDIKSNIHYRIRYKKDVDNSTSKLNEEIMLSCNRHLLIRWDLDFQ